MLRAGVGHACLVQQLDEGSSLGDSELPVGTIPSHFAAEAVIDVFHVTQIQVLLKVSPEGVTMNSALLWAKKE